MGLGFISGSSQKIVATGYKGIEGATNRTITFWWKGAFVNNNRILYYGKEAVNARFACDFYTTGGQNTIFIGVFGGNRAWRVGGTLCDGDWHLVSLVLNGANTNALECRVDDVPLVVQLTTAAAINTDVVTNDFAIGTAAYGGFLTGAIFDFRLYSTNLSAAQITAIFTNGKGCDGVDTNLELRYEFREETGVAVVVSDTSGNDRTGAAANNPAYQVDPFDACLIGRPITNKYNFENYYRKIA